MTSNDNILSFVPVYFQTFALVNACDRSDSVLVSYMRRLDCRIFPDTQNSNFSHSIYGSNTRDVPHNGQKVTTISVSQTVSFMISCRLSILFG